MIENYDPYKPPLCVKCGYPKDEYNLCLLDEAYRDSGLDNYNGTIELDVVFESPCDLISKLRGNAL